MSIYKFTNVNSSTCKSKNSTLNSRLDSDVGREMFNGRDEAYMSKLGN